MATYSSKQLSVPKPKVSDGPRTFPMYLDQCEQSLLQAPIDNMSEALKAPPAFEGTAWDTTPDADDHPLSNAYKDVADPEGTADQKKIDAMNKRVFTIIYAAAQQADHRMLIGIMDSAPFVRYSTFRAFFDSSSATNKCFWSKSVQKNN